MTQQTIRTPRRLTACLLLAALAGCASYQPRPLSAQRAIDTARSRSLSDPALVAYVARQLPPDAPRPPVWTFDALVWAAYRLNPDLAATRAKLGVAQAGEITAAERPNPSLSLPFDYTANPKPHESPYTFGLGLDIPIEAPDKRAARIAQSRQLSRAAQFEFGDAAWQVRSRLRSALLDLQHARRTETLQSAQVHEREQLVDMLSRRVALGEAAQVDLVQAQSDLAQAQADEAAAQRLAMRALAGVAQVVGVPTQAIASANLRLSAPPPTAFPTGRALDDALKNRADVQAALADYEASQAALQIAVASQYPDLHLGPGYTFDAGAHKYALSLSGIELMLFNQHQGEIAQAEAQRRQAAARFEAAAARCVAQVDQALAMLRSAQQEFAIAQRQRQEQARLMKAAQRSFDLGTISRLELTLARLRSSSTNLQAEEAEDRLQRAEGGLEDSLQRPLTGASPHTTQEQE